MIYSVAKEMEVAGCHHLKLSYESKCENLHGHNWKITVFLADKEVNEEGQLINPPQLPLSKREKCTGVSLNKSQRNK